MLFISSGNFQPWVCSSYADWPSAFVSTLGMDLSQGLTQTTLVSVINLFTMKTVLRTRIFQLHLTNLSVMDGLTREVKVIIKWLLSKHGIRRESHLTSWCSPQSVRVLSPDPLLHVHLLLEGFCPWPGYHYLLIIRNCFVPASVFAELPIHLSNYQSNPHWDAHHPRVQNRIAISQPLILVLPLLFHLT